MGLLPKLSSPNSLPPNQETGHLLRGGGGGLLNVSMEQVKFYPYKGATEKVLGMLGRRGGGGQNKFWGSFTMGIEAFSHIEGVAENFFTSLKRGGGG